MYFKCIPETHSRRRGIKFLPSINSGISTPATPSIVGAMSTFKTMSFKLK